VESGKRQIMAFCLPGDIQDLQSMALDKMDHTLGSLRACTIAENPHGAIRDLFEERPRLAEVLWRETLIDAAIFRKWLVSVGRRSAAGCIAHIICEFVTRMKAIGRSDGVTCEFPMTQTDLGDAAALSLVHVNRSLRELREAGIVNVFSNRLTIHDWEELKRFAEFDPSYNGFATSPPGRCERSANEGIHNVGSFRATCGALSGVGRRGSGEPSLP
jgi:CRP-like cAMP-binding protein